MFWKITIFLARDKWNWKHTREGISHYLDYLDPCLPYLNG